MLKKKAIEKILITTFTIFIIFVFYLIPEKINDKYLDVEQEKILEEVTYTLSYSVFANYDVKEIMIEVDGKEITKIK